MNEAPFFLEVDYAQKCKKGNVVSGDVFTSIRQSDDSVVTVLADGLGSGIKANVLATLTAKMAAGFVMNDMDIKRSAEIIISTLPVCAERKIGYSTFTVAKIERGGCVKVIEYDNPPFILFRNGFTVSMEPERIVFKGQAGRINTVNYYSFRLEYGDRLIFVSDGITQSGMGKERTPLGWGRDNLVEYVGDAIATNSSISARKLSQMVVSRACEMDDYFAHDDCTSEVIFCRRPRRLLVVSGPSVKPERDAEMASIITLYDGAKAICGGTTSMIVSRELGLQVDVDLTCIKGNLPPEGKMKGMDLVTEGILTLCRVSEMIEHDDWKDEPANPATKLIELMLNNDIIDFLVGTKINEAHQDPSMPLEIEIRRNIVKKIMRLLEEKHLKKTTLHFI
jgi:hypothetical protein